MALHAIYIGNSPTQKGYSIYDLKNNKISMGRDVVFYETISPLLRETSIHQTTDSLASTTEIASDTSCDSCVEHDELTLGSPPHPIVALPSATKREPPLPNSSLSDDGQIDPPSDGSGDTETVTNPP